MKTLIQRRDPTVERAEYPLADIVEGWFFRVNEMSPCHYLAEGVDLWGRGISHSGTDPDALLAECVRRAKQMVGATALPDQDSTTQGRSE
jgi:hypothetical protein